MKGSDTQKNQLNIEIFNRIKRLKMKASNKAKDDTIGEIDPENIKKADIVIQKAAEMYPMQIRNVLRMLYNTWSEIKKLPPEERQDRTEKLSNIANNIRDLAAQFGFGIMAHFGASLRNFLLSSDMSREEHVTIVQAHIGVMEIAYSQGLKDNEDPVAEELKAALAEAIEKYS